MFQNRIIFSNAMLFWCKVMFRNSSLHNCPRTTFIEKLTHSMWSFDSPTTPPTTPAPAPTLLLLAPAPSPTLTFQELPPLYS